MRIGQQALGHRHRQERNPGGLDEFPNHVVGLGIRGALAEHDQRSLRLSQHAQRAIDRVRRRQLSGGGVNDAPDRARRGVSVHGLAQNLTGDVQVDAAGPSGDRGANGTRDAAPDVIDPVDPIGGLGERLRGVELVEVLVVASLQIHQRPIAGAGDLDHRKAVRRRIRQRGQAVEETGTGGREAHTGPPGQESGGGRGVAGRGLLPEADVADSGRLRDAGEVGDRDADDPVDCGDVVGFQCVHHEVKPIDLACGAGRCRSCGHVATPRMLAVLPSQSL